ncbi:MAG: esterase-like activity of phytase family protein [Flavobacteriaceae bacterium]|nr:esterase-like activity of phytase family protein [Flavobacteriaceae bacterium]
MKKITYLLVLFLTQASCQDFGKMEFVADLPGKVNEISGIEKFPDQNVLWTINDSRNPPELYAFDLDRNKMGQTIRVKDAPNIDWEDLAIGPDGTLYVGNFGNNLSNRTDLAIYAIKNPSAWEKRRYEPVTTSFVFADQMKFPPKEKDKSYDVEAFFYWNDHFYLFTRNRAKKYDGTSKIYRLPAQPGEQTAAFIGEFKTCDDQSDCEITSAAIHHETGKIVLLSYNKVWVITDYMNDNFAHGKVNKIKLGHRSQKESICFKNENEVYIADERSRGVGGNLYSLSLDE